MSSYQKKRGYRRLVSRSPSELSEESKTTAGEQKKADAGVASRHMSHPMLKLFWSSNNKKKAVAKPEFLRYLGYMREAGKWDSSSDRPVIYFK